MALKSVPQETIDYIPSYAGNRDDKDPMWVRIQPLNRKEADYYRNQIQFTDQSQRGGFRQRGGMKTNIREVQKKQFTENVVEIHGFVDFKTDAEITDIKEFYDKAADDLIEEIFDAMLNASQLGEDEVKNSESQSGGSNPRRSTPKEESGSAETATS